ncbi:MAG TPA: hypothetical protein VKT82_31305 [Ktedonobacterales bacterium]|nr:hypothetical protein [Ktedonobacterales bacterium]
MRSFLHEIGVFGKRLKVHFRHHVIIKGREASFWVAISFLLTFGSVRFITARIRKQGLATQKNPQSGPRHQSRLGFHDIVLPGGLHIHHAVPGIFLTLMAGYLALITEKKGTRKLSVIYGMGSALALDEFALWLELRDVYWSKEGRLSFDAVAVAGAFFMGGYALSEFGNAILRDIHIRATTGVYPPHHPELANRPAAEGEGDPSAPGVTHP